MSLRENKLFHIMKWKLLEQLFASGGLYFHPGRNACRSQKAPTEWYDRVHFMEQGCCILILDWIAHVAITFFLRECTRANGKNTKPKKKKYYSMPIAAGSCCSTKPYRLYHMTKQLTGSHKQIQSINMQSKCDDESFINNFGPHPIPYMHIVCQSYTDSTELYQYVQWKIQFLTIRIDNFPNERAFFRCSPCTIFPTV